jgi:hypothetical protein
MLNSDFAYQSYIQSLARLTGQDANAFSEAITNEYDQKIIPGRTGFTEVGKDYEFVRDYKAEEAFKAGTKKAASTSGFDSNANGDFVSSKLKIANNNPAVFKTIGENYYGNIGTSQKVGLSSSALGFFGPAAVPGILAQGLGLSDFTGLPDKVKGLFGEEKAPTYSELMTSTKYANAVNRDRLKSIKDANPNISDIDLIKVYNDKEKHNQLLSDVQYVNFETSAGGQEAADKMLGGLKAGGYNVFEIDHQTGQVKQVAATDVYTELAVADQAKKGITRSKTPAIGFAMGYTTHVPSGSILIPKGGDSNNVYAIQPNRTDFNKAQNEILDQLFKPLLTGYGSLPVKFGTNADGTPNYISSKKQYINGDEVISFHVSRWNEKGQPEVDPEPILADDGSVLGPNGVEMHIMKDLFINLVPKKSKGMFTAETLISNLMGSQS